MNIFISGGAGYIGSATAEALIKAGHSVTVFDSLVTGHRAAVPEGANFIHANLDDSHALAEALTSNKFDAIMHFAAFIEAGESMRDPGKFFRNNFTNSLKLMEIAIQTGVKKLVFSSTAAVYQSSETPLTEDSPLGPTNVYGHTKLMTEQALEWYRKFMVCISLLFVISTPAELCPAAAKHINLNRISSRVFCKLRLGQAELRDHLRHRLSHARWHLHPRLHPHC